MAFADNIDHPPLLRRPIVMAPAIAALFVILWQARAWLWTPVKYVLEAAGQGRAGGPMIAAGLALLIGANFYLLMRLPKRLQIALVWIELALLLGLFFLSFDLSFSFIRRKLWLLISVGLVNTLYISAISIALASILALAGAMAKLSSSGIALGVATFYTSFFRGIPLLMQIYIIYLGLPQVGVVIDAIPSGIIALSLCYGAYMTEIFRAGIESVPRGQWEAARALGFGRGDILRRIILPQAMGVIIPPTGNQVIAMLKDSSLVSVIGVWELMYLAHTEGQTEFRHIEMMLTASIIYWVMSGMLEIVQARIEAHFGRANVR
ncbi:MAG TPA: amino acid ABC transporter permease [Caulobacteraceae bacterium]|jgi:polar amino acid transport system permease protein|nr:amino acid ABC transporter permease [Caulobacteraceae bacterium]